jgi:hypothetical protein
VIAYCLLTLGTIEEKIWELQQMKKAALVRDVLGEDGFGRSRTREDLSYLLQEAWNPNGATGGKTGGVTLSGLTAIRAQRARRASHRSGTRL